MNTMPVAERMTADAFLSAPEPESGWPRNLIDGEVVVNDPSVRHGYAQKQILVAIELWIRAGEGRGSVHYPLDVALDQLNVFKPDVAWYSPDRTPRIDDPSPYPMPDLAVEVRSPSTWRYDIGVKKAAYERNGLTELWLVDTAAKAVLVFRCSQRGSHAFDLALELDGDDCITTPLLPGFGLAAAALFAQR